MNFPCRGLRPGIALLRALVVHRDPEAASALVDVLGAPNGSAELPSSRRRCWTRVRSPARSVAARPTRSSARCRRPTQALVAVRETCELAGIALVLTDPDAGATPSRDAHGCAAHEPDPTRLAAAVLREHACAQDRSAAATAQRLLSAQQTIADHLAADLPPEGLLREALGVLAQLFDAAGGIAWELPADRGELIPRAAHGDATLSATERPSSPTSTSPAAPRSRCATVADGAQVAVPLVAGGACEGVLELHLAPGARPDARLMADVAALASQVALHLRYRRGAAMLDLHERALAATNNGIVIADADPETGGWPVSYVNEAFELLTGWRSEEVVGRSLSILQGEETDPEPVAEMAAALRAGEECWVTLRNYRRDGSPFWNEVFLTPVHDADGVARRYIGVLHDVTARVTSAVELEEAEARYRTLIETIPAVTYIADWDELGSFRYVSPQIEELLGYPARSTGSATSALWEEQHAPRRRRPRDGRDALRLPRAEGVRLRVPHDRRRRPRRVGVGARHRDPRRGRRAVPDAGDHHRRHRHADRRGGAGGERGAQPRRRARAGGGAADLRLRRARAVAATRPRRGSSAWPRRSCSTARPASGRCRSCWRTARRSRARRCPPSARWRAACRSATSC